MTALDRAELTNERRRRALSANIGAVPTMNNMAVPNQPGIPAGYQGSADLARRKYELAKAQAEGNTAMRLGQIGRDYFQAAGGLESNLESRGILKSGEAMRNRVSLGAEEKAAREAALMQQEMSINEAALDYASRLAQLQALGSPAVTPAPTPSATPARRRRPGGGGGGSSSSGGSDTSTGADNSSSTGSPKPFPTVGGKPVRPGDTPSETRGVPPRIVKPKPPTGGGGGGKVTFR